MRWSCIRFKYEKLNKCWIRFSKKQMKVYDNEPSKGNRDIIGIWKYDYAFYFYNR